jgi:hypothetical protein
MRFICHSGAIYTSCSYTSLKRSSAKRLKVVSTNINFESFHKPSDFQVQPEHLSIAISVDTNGRYQSFCGSFIILQISSISRYTSGVVQATSGVEFEESIGLKV